MTAIIAQSRRRPEGAVHRTLTLGQVLTNKVFSVLMGDEVDASMDDDRAGYTAECLERLTKSIGQVVLVSHKQTDAEHHIEVS